MVNDDDYTPKDLDPVELATSVAAAAASAAAEAAAEAAAANANTANAGPIKKRTRLDQFADDDSMSAEGWVQAGQQDSMHTGNTTSSMADDSSVSSTATPATTRKPSHAFEDTPPSRVLHIRRLPAYVSVSDITKAFEPTGLRVECVKILEQKKQALAQLECVEDANLALQYFNQHHPYVRETRVFVNFSRNPQIDKPTEPGEQNWEIAMASTQGLAPSAMQGLSQPMPMAPLFGGEAMELISTTRKYMQQYNPYGAMVPLNINEREGHIKFRKLR